MAGRRLPLNKEFSCRTGASLDSKVEVTFEWCDFIELCWAGFRKCCIGLSSASHQTTQQYQELGTMAPLHNEKRLTREMTMVLVQHLYQNSLLKQNVSPPWPTGQDERLIFWSFWSHLLNNSSLHTLSFIYFYFFWGGRDATRTHSRTSWTLPKFSITELQAPI